MQTKITVCSVIVAAVSLIASLSGALKGILPFDIAWIAILLCGIPIVYGALKALITEGDIKADVLVAMALVASLYIRECFAAGEVALIMQIGTLLEGLTAKRARRGIARLVKLTPQTARIRRGGENVVIPVEEVKRGDTLTVLVGDTIPADGVIISGEASIDQSVMTGESIPVDKGKGDRVISGTINQCGTFEMKAVEAGMDSSVQRMARLAKEAEANKAPIVSLADKWATWMVVIALGLSALAFLLTGQVIRAVTVLVVICPCAFILATPTAIMAGIDCATRFGLLVKSGETLERLAHVSTVAFDKTGTLTMGRPKVTGAVSTAARFTSSDILCLAASAEQRSEHPLGKAILNRYLADGGEVIPITDPVVKPGMGVTATVCGSSVSVGRLGDTEKVGDFCQRGETVVGVVVDSVPSGFIILSDTLRPNAEFTIARLKGDGLTPVLLTGDNETVARDIAQKVGIDEVYAGLLPQDKMDLVKQAVAGGKKICMVGDGVNDTLALRSAYVSIAMGGIGSDIVTEASDSVLIGDEISHLPYLFQLARKVMIKIKQNIVISLGINLVAVALSFFGALSPVTGAILHNCGSVFVVLNAALLFCGNYKRTC